MELRLIVILILTLILPIAFKKIEHSLEVFLFIMGAVASIVSGVISTELIIHILSNKLIYVITLLVLCFGLIFNKIRHKAHRIIIRALNIIPIKIFVLLIILVLGLLSSIITAIIASMILVEIITLLPLDRETRIRICITACFNIGIGASLTPIGEPISTIVVSKLNADFWFIARNIGIYVLLGTILLSILGALLARNKVDVKADGHGVRGETNTEVVKRACKIFLFIIALELLGAGFKPMIDIYVANLDSRILYWGNTISAVLDNATLAAAEIGPQMMLQQIKAILVGLLISGGMLIPGNVPNIICAGKLKISNKEWAFFGVPLGIALLLANYILLFLV